jgi:GTP cyclohydrolase IA
MRGSFEPVSLVSASLQDLVRETLIRIGENPDRDGLVDTPERLEHSLQYLTKGYGEDAKDILLDAMFDVAYDEMVIIKDIEVFSLCETSCFALLPQGSRCLCSARKSYWP